MADEIFFRMREIDKIYPLEGENVHALKKVSLTLEEGEYLSVLGPSGSGKSTLMNIIGCLDTPTSGEYILRGREIDDLNEQELAELRNREIGFIYTGIKPKERRERAEAMLERVGLIDRMDHLPSQLSGGQQQRVAIARAMVGNPSILLADEPTGALDQKTGAQIMQLFRELNEEKRTVIMITHDLKIASNARRVVHIIDGEITEGVLQDA